MPSSTVYLRWGKGPKQPLRFTKTGDTNLEEAYATHATLDIKVEHTLQQPGPPHAR